jgi:hypothetical protein
LLISATTTYDATFSTRPNKKGVTRQVYSHYIFSPPPYDFTIDSTVPDFNSIENLCLEINQTSRGNNSTAQLSLQQWRQLTPEAQTTWDLLDHTAKRTILEKRMNYSNNHKPGLKTHSANLHDISAYEYINSNLRDQHLGNEPNTTDDPNASLLQPDNSLPDTQMLDTLQAHKVQSKLPPGDISRLLSTKMSKTQQAKSRPSDTVNSREITINGVKYRQCNTASSH